METKQEFAAICKDFYKVSLAEREFRNAKTVNEGELENDWPPAGRAG